MVTWLVFFDKIILFRRNLINYAIQGDVDDDDDDDRDATYTSGENSEFCNDAFLHPDVFIHSEP